MIKIKIKRLITSHIIKQYAAVSKDHASIHVNAEVATKIGYKRPIAHGMYVMGLAQSIYLMQHPTKWIMNYNMTFQKPLLVDTVAIFEYIEHNEEIIVSVSVESGEVIASGAFSVKERSL
ncbi:MAG: MaoC family dehydratase [Candidatus Pristimantibacillus lignocellulolyticus]|uniref:MaoC family dehydratase n=1 Tax=Candidatus Pristimantibacillus lignocellulolyticus TaxID=2994561 RepID=A0A9J6ZCF7_9BACL|nr:MAG: MaoC family dehydratase [Candidatus Pristimantibacillus lignocellulolyticus]